MERGTGDTHGRLCLDACRRGHLVTLTAGATLGPYEILARVGAGGMGEVYKAHDSRLNRTVAIKVLPAALTANPDARLRLNREAKAVAALSHPHICSLFDIGHQDGTDFLVMEFLEGETLAERLTRGKLPIDEALRTGIQIADGLATAHKAAIIHRDLKPGNIMLTKRGATLLDFGLAKPPPVALSAGMTQVATEQALTGVGTLVGTLQYMAPEQLQGLSADAGTDVFAFGCVLYEMVTGRRAFAGESQASLISAILSSEPPPIAVTQPLSPPSLDRLVRTLPRERSRQTLGEHPRRPVAAAVDGAGETVGRWRNGLEFEEARSRAMARRRRGRASRDQRPLVVAPTSAITGGVHTGSVYHAAVRDDSRH